jgi:hypothetical protein
MLRDDKAKQHFPWNSKNVFFGVELDVLGP